ncbi:hypothetical protein P7K49_012042 [Saguinus oedipus]|uniref:Uncharacterized protein n=1 Tax=Saguinus oedipus TaxID=9490 RepID=A0ABQ9VSD8_SAGOE|nr:hypothetical protein P7K49_012042 [Saguinus oedipus]
MVVVGDGGSLPHLGISRLSVALTWGLSSRRGWFPFSYTRVLDSDGSDRLHMSLQQGKSSSTGNLLDKDDLAIPPPDYGATSRAFPAQTASGFKQRPYSVAVPAFSQVSKREGSAYSPTLEPLLTGQAPGGLGLFGQLWGKDSVIWDMCAHPCFDHRPPTLPQQAPSLGMLGAGVGLSLMVPISQP